MISLNDNNIFIGQIKQLLHDFNLPNCVIGRKNPAANRHFIDDGYIWLWKNVSTDGTLKLEAEKICPYTFNKAYMNLTTTFPIYNNIYDRSTHRYLGRYLRFIRDFRGVDLMSMYNCFDGEVFDKSISIDKNGVEINFSSSDGSYTTYTCPVDFKSLSIRISSGKNCYLGLFVDNIDEDLYSYDDLNKKLLTITTKKFYANEVLQFDPAELIKKSLKNNPDELQKMLQFIGSRIKHLRLLIRVANSGTPNIAVLEGNYQVHNSLTDIYFIMQPLERSIAPLLVSDINNDNSYNFMLTDNNEIMLVSYLIDPQNNPNFKHPLNLKESGFHILSQLLQTNDSSQKQYLLGDRIAEYLSGNAICPLSNSYEIKRVQKTYNKIGNAIIGANLMGSSKYTYGVWSILDTYNTRNFIVKNRFKIKNNYDLLGYVDKDVEDLIGDKLDELDI